MIPQADEGDPAAFAKTALLFSVLSLFFFSCQKPSKASVRALPLRDTAAAVPKPPPMALRKKPKSSKKKLYITFDDGPNKGTANVLRITGDEGVPISFFLVGEHAFASAGQNRCWDSLRLAAHVDLCNHSYTHGAHNRYQRFYENPDSVVADFRRAQDSLKLGNAIVRTPGRNIWRMDSLHYTDLRGAAAAADSLRQAGFVVMGWDLEWQYDHKSMSVNCDADELLRQIDSAFTHSRTRRHGHLVLLAHDQVYGKSGDSLQLRKLLQLLKQRDEYELSLVTDYPGALAAN